MALCICMIIPGKIGYMRSQITVQVPRDRVQNFLGCGCEFRRSDVLWRNLCNFIKINHCLQFSFSILLSKWSLKTFWTVRCHACHVPFLLPQFGGKFRILRGKYYLSRFYFSHKNEIDRSALLTTICLDGRYLRGWVGPGDGGKSSLFHPSEVRIGYL